MNVEVLRIRGLVDNMDLRKRIVQFLDRTWSLGRKNPEKTLLVFMAKSDRDFMLQTGAKAVESLGGLLAENKDCCGSHTGSYEQTPQDPTDCVQSTSVEAAGRDVRTEAFISTTGYNKCLSYVRWE